MKSLHLIGKIMVSPSTGKSGVAPEGLAPPGAAVTAEGEESR